MLLSAVNKLKAVAGDASDRLDPSIRRPGALRASPPRLGAAICRSASGCPGPAQLAQSPSALGGAITGVGVARRSTRGLGRSPSARLLRSHAPCNRSPRGSLALRSGSYASAVTQRRCSSTESLCGPPPPRRVSWRSFRRGPRAFRRVCGGRNLPRRARAGIGRFRPATS